MDPLTQESPPWTATSRLAESDKDSPAVVRIKRWLSDPGFSLKFDVKPPYDVADIRECLGCASMDIELHLEAQLTAKIKEVGQGEYKVVAKRDDLLAGRHINPLRIADLCNSVNVEQGKALLELLKTEICWMKGEIAALGRAQRLAAQQKSKSLTHVATRRTAPDPRRVLTLSSDAICSKSDFLRVLPDVEKRPSQGFESSSSDEQPLEDELVSGSKAVPIPARSKNSKGEAKRISDSEMEQ